MIYKFQLDGQFLQSREQHAIFTSLFEKIFGDF